MTTYEEIMGYDEGMTFAQMKKLLRGPQGIQGWEGRSPMHVQETRPTGKDLKEGDLWYQPSTRKLSLYDGSQWDEIAKRGVMGLEGEKGKDGRSPVIHRGTEPPKNPHPGDLWIKD